MLPEATVTSGRRRCDGFLFLVLLNAAPMVIFVLAFQHGHEIPEEKDEVLDVDEVAVLMVSHLPRGFVIDRESLGHGHGLPEVYQPDTGLLRVVHEEQGATDQLEAIQLYARGEDRCDDYVYADLLAPYLMRLEKF